MSGNLRREALSIFKKLHRTRQKTFQGDDYALEMTKNKLRDEFKKNKHVTNEESIKELITFATQVENEIRTTVVQIVEKKPNVYEARITEDTVKLDNIPIGQSVDRSQFRNWKKCTDPPEKKIKS